VGEEKLGGSERRGGKEHVREVRGENAIHSFPFGQGRHSHQGTVRGHRLLTKKEKNRSQRKSHQNKKKKKTKRAERPREEGNLRGRGAAKHQTRLRRAGRTDLSTRGKGWRENQRTCSEGASKIETSGEGLSSRTVQSAEHPNRYEGKWPPRCTEKGERKV